MASDDCKDASIIEREIADGMVRCCDCCPFTWKKLQAMHEALCYMADYQLTGTEQTLHIDFQGKAREALDVA